MSVSDLRIKDPLKQLLDCFLALQPTLATTATMLPVHLAIFLSLDCRVVVFHLQTLLGLKQSCTLALYKLLNDQTMQVACIRVDATYKDSTRFYYNRSYACDPSPALVVVRDGVEDEDLVVAPGVSESGDLVPTLGEPEGGETVIALDRPEDKNIVVACDGSKGGKLVPLFGGPENGESVFVLSGPEDKDLVVAHGVLEGGKPVPTLGGLEGAKTVAACGIPFPIFGCAPING
ncbi:hypothetical protein BC835DRAFT_1308260 [Cytidiella melzeri]|nr:hypothetical protein BC835DRAFT_1308260 [Cytidiella melzeri]